MVAQPDPRILGSAARQAQEGANSVGSCNPAGPNDAVLKTRSLGYVPNAGLQLFGVWCCKPARLGLHPTRVCSLRCAVVQTFSPGSATRRAGLTLTPRAWQPSARCQQPGAPLKSTLIVFSSTIPSMPNASQ
jgi:hypothetical protein